MIITITLNPALDRTLRIEHPLEVGKLNRSSSSHLEPGGKGINVSRAVKALGGNSIALGFTAGTNGRVMKDMLTAADIHYDFVDVAGQLRVNTQILDAQGGHTEVNEPGSKLDDADFLRLIDRMENYLDEGNIFVLAGSTPPDFPLKNYRKLCKTIKRHGCKLIIDAQGDLLLEALQCEPDFVKPNIFELAEAVGDKPSADPEVVVHSARKMLDMGARAVCVSMSQEGAVLVFQGKFSLLVLGVNHQARSISVKAVHHVSLTVLTGLVEVIIQYALYIQGRMTGSHTENAHVLFDDDKITILIDNLKITALEDILVLLGLAHAHLHTRFQGIVKLGDGFAIHLDSPALQSLLHLGLTRTFHVFHQPFQQLRRLLHPVVVVFIGISVAISIVGVLTKISFSILLSHVLKPISCFGFIFCS